MCGIIGAVSERDVVPILLEGLKRLEYRGYDSAGLAVVNGKLQRVRSAGRVAELEKRAHAKRLSGEIGIAHTRWATHGEPSERNAHPHVSGDVSVVHNGIIENHEPIRERLRSQGYDFASDTDTEVIAHLVHSNLRPGEGLLPAVRRSVAELAGAYAIAVIDAAKPKELVVARYGAPLLLGLGDRENFAASDTSALIQVTQRMIYLKDGDCAAVTTSGVRILDAKGRTAQRPVHMSQNSAATVDLGAYRHYMQKEIFEQPEAVARTLGPVTATGEVSPQLFGMGAERTLGNTRNVLIIACGTSYHAGMVARYWMESLAGLPTDVEIASEYRYRQPVADPRTLVVTVSQSGETADTIAALEHAKRLGQPHSLAICNVPESALVRASELRFLTRAGPEIGVASTKAFTSQVIALALLTLKLGRLRTMSVMQGREIATAMLRLPQQIQSILDRAPEIEELAERFKDATNFLYLGRGYNFPVALEGALKLKEISYIHAEGYPAAEMKHGPIALIDSEMPVVFVAPHDAVFDKVVSNIQEVKARGGRVICITSQDEPVLDGMIDYEIRVPQTIDILYPILTVIPLQLLAYYIAVKRGLNVDQPRNLAKSVTVE